MLTIKNKQLLIILAYVLIGGSSIVHAELPSDTDRAHCAGYADSMANLYKSRHYKLMSEYFGLSFERDGSQSQDPHILQSLYDEAYQAIDKKGRISENYDAVCEDDFVAFFKELKQKAEAGKGTQ